MFQRHQLKVDSLHPRPNHPVLLQRSRVCALQLIPRTRPLHNRHTTQKDKEICRGEDGLVGQDSGSDGGVWVLEDYFVLEDFEPGRCRGAEDS